MQTKLGRYGMQVVRRIYREADFAVVRQVRYPHLPDFVEAKGEPLELLAARGATLVQLEVSDRPLDPAYPELRQRHYPDWHVGDLIQPTRLPTGLALCHQSFQVLKLALGIEYDKARASAETYDWKFVRPRHRQMIACNEHGERCERYDEPQDWNGTLRDLVSFAMDAAEHGAAEIYIEGGFDGSEWFDFSDYTPTEEFYGVTAVTIAKKGTVAS